MVSFVNIKKYFFTNQLLFCMAQALATFIAAALAETGALRLSPREPFRWASGILSPIYCDNRITLSFPEVRTFIKNALSESIQQSFPDVEVIAGVATAGIPQGVLISDMLNLPFVYVRPRPKDHGTEKLVEGVIRPDMKAVVVEDLISTAGSALKAVEALKLAGAQVVGLAAVFSYELEKARVSLNAAGVPLVYLCGYNDLVEEISRKGMLSKEEIWILKQWHQDPEIFSI